MSLVQATSHPFKEASPQARYCITSVSMAVRSRPESSRPVKVIWCEPTGAPSLTFSLNDTSDSVGTDRKDEAGVGPGCAPRHGNEGADYQQEND